MPSLSITPGRKFSITTSACAASCLTMVIASGFERSSVRLRLLPLIACQPGARPRSAHSRRAVAARDVFLLVEFGAAPRQLFRAHLRDVVVIELPGSILAPAQRRLHRGARAGRDLQ